VRRADNLITFMCRWPRNPGASASWNPKGLSRRVVGKLYVYLAFILYTCIYVAQVNLVNVSMGSVLIDVLTSLCG
jgi:hypothetical protein